MKTALKILSSILFIVFLAACTGEELPEGRYFVYPADHQIITPGATAEYAGRTFILIDPPTPYFDTPTPDNTLPPPSATPTPEPERCMVTFKSGWNIRRSPVTGTIAGNTASLTGPVEVVDYTQTGWLAFEYLGNSAWVIEASQGTTSILTSTPTDCYKAFIVAMPGGGPWTTVGTRADDVARFADTMLNAGQQPAFTVYAAESLLPVMRQHHAIIILRPWLGGKECPNMTLNVKQSAQEYVSEALAAVAGKDYDWLSLTNECRWPSAEWVRDWIDEALDLCAAAGVKQVIPVVWYSGAPELLDIPTLITAYQNTPVTVAFGVNLYPIVEGMDLSSTTGSSDWLQWRYRMYEGMLPDNVGIIVTEAARGWGSERPVWEDLRAWNNLTFGDFIAITYWYSAGPNGLVPWQNASMYAEDFDNLAEVLIN